MKDIVLEKPGAEIYIPAGIEPGIAFERTTHLGVGAHQDDLEFMAMHGIIECFHDPEKWFSGITCTNGSGSARTGPYAQTSDQEMQQIRAEEQREAARTGDYAFMAQLGYSSAELKGTHRLQFEADLRKLLAAAAPQVIYTHNPADKHATHIAVVVSLIESLRSLPMASRPEKLIGCEGWRDLDWLPDDKKVVMDLSSNPDLAARLNGIFKSQISGGKRYDLAVQGRRSANATFLDSHSVDTATSVCFGMDLTPLIRDDTLSIWEFTDSLIRQFRDDVMHKLNG